MNGKRKTIRFHDTPDDMAVYDAICDFRKYHFRSESHMVIEAVRQMISKETDHMTAERIADIIIKKLGPGVMTNDIGNTPKPSPRSATETDAFDTALIFLNNL